MTLRAAAGKQLWRCHFKRKAEGGEAMIEYNHIFGDQRKRKYGLFSNLAYCIGWAYRVDKKLFASLFVPVLPWVAVGLLGTYLPAEVVRGLEEGWDIGRLGGHLLLLILPLWLCNMVMNGMLEYVDNMGWLVPSVMSRKCMQKMLRMDYHFLEEPGKQNLIGNAWAALKNTWTFVGSFFAIPFCLSGILGSVCYGVLIGRVNLPLMLLAAANVCVSLAMLKLARKKHGQYRDKLSRHAKATAYINRESMEVPAGKDIRIYRMLDWMLGKYDRALKEMDDIFRVIHNWYFLGSFTTEVCGFAVDAFAYIYLIVLLVQGNISVSDFVLYLGAIRGLQKYLGMCIRQFMSLPPASVSISYVREFLELEESEGWERQISDERLADVRRHAAKLELKNVSFTYPGKTEATISHIDLIIRPGEKLALLGLNGAGKTTLVKLICGFYQPTEGEILLNDIPIRQYGREEYYSLVSVLFQDAVLLPVSLEENLTGALSEDIDQKKLESALELSGFAEKYHSLPAQGKTRLVREANADAADFSGGEKQKLFFARAIYKDAPLMILDEPTAALDPIAENELYMKYDRAMTNRTSIYISHRLSSTRFCDRIVLLEHGCIVEEGTHESLMQGDTRYAHLFAVQSKYYKEQAENRRRSELMGDTYQESEDGKEGIFHE